MELLLKEKKMNGKKQALAFLSLFAALVGGMVLNQLVVGKAAIAQQEAEPHKVIVAEEFRVVNKEGKVLASLGTPAGEPGIVLFNREGKIRAVLSLVSTEQTPILSLLDTDGKHRATVGMKANGEPYIALRNKESRVSISLSEGKVTVYGEDEKVVWSKP
jgi:hypothetical protein